MVRHGQTCEPLQTFLQTFGVSKHEAGEQDLCKHYPCWKSLKLTDKWLSDFPRHLRPRIYERWFSINGFRFLDLPPELREAILMFAIGPVAEPFARSHRVVRCVDSQLFTPNMGLALVSKQIHNEFIPLLFATATVYISKRDQFVRFFRHACFTPRPRLSEKLRILALDLAPHTLLGLFGVTMLYDWTGYHCTQKHSRANDVFVSVCLDLDALKELKIHIQHVNLAGPVSRTICQKAFTTIMWSAAREYIRNIPCVEFKGYVCASQKRSWLEVLDSDRKGIETGTAGDLLEWKRQMWDEWYV